jgi:hypothetical protein
MNFSTYNGQMDIHSNNTSKITMQWDTTTSTQQKIFYFIPMFLKCGKSLQPLFRRIMNNNQTVIQFQA